MIIIRKVKMHSIEFTLLILSLAIYVNNAHVSAFFATTTSSSKKFNKFIHPNNHNHKHSCYLYPPPPALQGFYQTYRHKTFQKITRIQQHDENINIIKSTTRLRQQFKNRKNNNRGNTLLQLELFQGDPSSSSSIIEPSSLFQIAALSSVSYLAIPTAHLIFNYTTTTNTDITESNSTTYNHHNGFQKTFLYETASSAKLGSQISLILYITDIIADTMKLFNIQNYDHPTSSSSSGSGSKFFYYLNQLLSSYFENTNLESAAPKIGFILWASLTLQSWKRLVIAKAASKEIENLGRISVFNSFFDIIISVVGLLFILDELDIDFGPGLASLFAAGGIGALAFSLATKDFAEQIVGGLVIQAWDVFTVGDDVILGDGTAGIVNRIGLVETELKGPDGVTEKIPNSLLYKQRVKNLSRVQVCQVRQVLRFPIQDIPRMASIIADIKSEIVAACPKLIVDGSKPFTVTLYNFKEDYLEVVVNTFHDIKPGSTFYLDNRQNMLFAIAKAVEKNGSAMGKIPSM